MKELWLVPAALIAAVLLSPVLALYYGWSASVLWGWFMVPLGAPALGAVQCAGIALAVRAFQGASITPKETDHVAYWGAVVFGPLVVVGVGWLFKAWFL